MKNQFFADGLTAEEKAENKKECDKITGERGWFGENYHTLCMMHHLDYSGMCMYVSTLVHMYY